MKKNRLINEEYWSQFINVDSKTGKVVHDGHRFEELIECLLNLMYSEIEWKPTKITHDGNKDFKAKNGEETYWAECKNYKTKIDLKTLAATLIMAEIESVNSIFFFCYSEINNNTKTKLNSYSKSNQKSIFFFDGIVLDQLILKYKDDIFPQFFPDLQEQINNINNFAALSEPTVLCYLERNPFFNGTPEFDMQNLTELQDLKLGEIIGIHIITINADLDKSIQYSIELIFPETENYFEVFAENGRIEKENRTFFRHLTLQAGATGRKSIYLKLYSWAPKVSLPKIICKVGRKRIGKFQFPLISTLRTRQTAFLGSNYIEEKEYLCKTCLNQNKLSVIYIYGNSGTGKSRMISECATEFIAQGYYIIKLVNSRNAKHSTYVMLKELIFALYGFTDEIIEYIIQNSYEKLENYNYDSYKEIFRIIRIIYDNRHSLSQIDSLEYTIIYEKLAKGKYFLVIDDIQYWDDQAVSFLKNFYYYASSMQRKCDAIIGIAANTDVLYNQQTMEFLAELVSKRNSYNNNIYPYNLTGFETVNQSYLFLKEILGMDDDFDEIEELTDFSLKPKYITEVANYLQDIKAIEFIKNKAIIADKSFFKEALKKLPITLHTILHERWRLYLKNSVRDNEYYKKIISSILFLESVELENNRFGVLHKEDIESLYQYGFLKKGEDENDIYVFEHDSLRFYFQEYYKDWFEVAVSYLKNSEQNLLKGHRLECVCDLYENSNITADDYYNYIEFEYSNEIKYKITERILRFILEDGTDNIFCLVQNILRTVREQFGEKRTESLFKIFEDTYDFKSERLTNTEYCIIMINYAENQLKLKSVKKAIELYDTVLKKLNMSNFPEREHMLANIYNRYFVCGRVGGSIQQYSEKWNRSMNLAVQKQFFDVCIENLFDKAQSLFLDANATNEAIAYLEEGCDVYRKYQPQNLKGQYLYRDVQLSFIKKDYAILENKIWKSDEEISSDNDIKFKLFFRIQFLIFKITLCLIGKKVCTDFEMENMLEQLNMFQSMQNKLQLYRCFYLYGKYYTQKHNWEKAYLLYQKVFDNLSLNKHTEEICLQREFIVQDMIINFRKNKFPFEKYDMSVFNSIIKNDAFKKVMHSSDEYFMEFFDKYIPLTPISNTQTKEGYLLF